MNQKNILNSKFSEINYKLYDLFLEFLSEDFINELIGEYPTKYTEILKFDEQIKKEAYIRIAVENYIVNHLLEKKSFIINKDDLYKIIRLDLDLDQYFITNHLEEIYIFLDSILGDIKNKFYKKQKFFLSEKEEDEKNDK